MGMQGVGWTCFNIFKIKKRGEVIKRESWSERERESLNSYFQQLLVKETKLVHINDSTFPLLVPLKSQDHCSLDSENTLYRG